MSFSPPSGFKQRLYPLRHKFYNAFGLSAVDADTQTTYVNIIRNYKSANDPDTIDVNPKHASFDKETGAVCNPMSIIERLTMKLTFTLGQEVDAQEALKCWWQPVINTFPEKLDAADEFSTTTVAALLGLVKDATEEDITPLYNNIKCQTTQTTSDRTTPMSTVNLTETFGILNMDTSVNHEAVTYDDEELQNALLHYTNKGALRSCLGRRRYMTLTKNRPVKNFFVDKPVPRTVRRIMPYTYMGLLIHVPVQADDDQVYIDNILTANTIHIGVTCKVRYNEWHNEHNQDLAG